MVCVLQWSDDSAPLAVIRDKLSPRRHFLFVQLKDPPPFCCLQYGSLFFFIILVKVYQPLTVGVDGTKAGARGRDADLWSVSSSRIRTGGKKMAQQDAVETERQASDPHAGAPHAEI